MYIVTISDTHGQHRKLKLPDADMIIHAGDVSASGSVHEVTDFLQWFGNLPFQYKLFIAGNHDFWLEDIHRNELNSLVPAGMVYLNDSGCIIEGLHIWGSPVTPRYHDWAFNRSRGAEINCHWNLIPPDTDILVTHVPAAGILDRNAANESLGCEDLLKRVREVRPRYHICGHIHEGYGIFETEHTCFINACVLDKHKKQLMNKPVLFHVR